MLHRPQVPRALPQQRRCVSGATTEFPTRPIPRNGQPLARLAAFSRRRARAETRAVRRAAAVRMLAAVLPQPELQRVVLAQPGPSGYSPARLLRRWRESVRPEPQQAPAAAANAPVSGRARWKPPQPTRPPAVARRAQEQEQRTVA